MSNELFGVKIKTADWMPVDKALFIYNGVEEVVRLDGTDKEARVEVRKPRWVIVHLGPTPFLERLKRIWRKP